MNPLSQLVIQFPSLYCAQVFFAVLIGAFAIGQAAPNFVNLLTAAGSSGVIYDTIDRVGGNWNVELHA